jgi:hypothetical protein
MSFHRGEISRFFAYLEVMLGKSTSTDDSLTRQGRQIEGNRGHHQPLSSSKIEVQVAHINVSNDEEDYIQPYHTIIHCYSYQVLSAMGHHSRRFHFAIVM